MDDSIKKAIKQYLKEAHNRVLRNYHAKHKDIERIILDVNFKDFLQGSGKLVNDKRLNELLNVEQKRFQEEMRRVIQREMYESWTQGNRMFDKMIQTAYMTNKNRTPDLFKWDMTSWNKLKNRQLFSGRTLSGRIWTLSNAYKRDILDVLQIGVLNGDSAADLSRRLARYSLYANDKLIDINKLTDKEVRDAVARRSTSKKGSMGTVLKDAKRLAGNESNIAFRESENSRMQSYFVLGFKINLSNAHPRVDICDYVNGDYPKTFKWNGWHVNCYSNDTEVYTDKGWKLFKDVDKEDLILSLDPKTYDLEYTSIVMKQQKHHKGDMVHFFNRSLDILVTPEHDMLVNNKSKGKEREFRRVKAKDCGVTQPIYRISEWVGEHFNKVSIGEEEFDFDAFCEFMGYWLADGSLGHKWEIIIAQADEGKFQIFECIQKLNLNPRYNDGRVEVNNEHLYKYLKQFGLAPDKFVPEMIKKSTPKQIQIFLDAFVSCDGYIQKAKPFVGNRGNLCIPKEDDRIYFTTSKRMADDIGELILKIGRRPSFRAERTKGKLHKFRNGTYKINHDLVRISERRSARATQYNKEIIQYDDMVYDLTLAKNHTMYVRRNGKCFWGSNCLCYRTFILMSLEDQRAYQKAIKQGKKPKIKGLIEDVPAGFKQYMRDHYAQMNSWKSKPYFMVDNYIERLVE